MKTKIEHRDIEKSDHIADVSKMVPYTYPLHNGFGVICAEITPHGFTNHRVEVLNRHDGGFVVTTSELSNHDAEVSDLALAAEVCLYLGCVSNRYLAAAAKRAEVVCTTGKL